MSEPISPPSGQDIEILLDAATKLEGIVIQPEWRATAILNLMITAEAAAFVAAFPLNDEAEPAPIFIP